jgi:hypothetical protein
VASPFQPIKAQATTGRPVKGLTQMPSLGGAASPMPQMPKIGSGPHVSMSGQASKGFAQPTPNKIGGAFTHETRGGAAPVGATQGIDTHNTVPHISAHPGKGMTP